MVLDVAVDEGEDVVRYLLMVDVEEEELRLSVTDGAVRCFVLPLSPAYLDRHRARSGIEGSWAAYFSLLRQAF